MLDCGPFTFTEDSQTATVDDQVDRARVSAETQWNIKECAPPGERGVVWDIQVNVHELEDREQEPFGLAQR